MTPVDIDERRQQLIAVCGEIALGERISKELATEARFEQSISFDAVLARRHCRQVVYTVLAVSSRVWVADGKVDMESTRRDELLCRLRRFNYVLPGVGYSYAAWMLRRVLS